MIQDFWYSSGANAGGGGDQGQNIGNSLRFRGGQHLNRASEPTISLQTFTLSFWTKLAINDTGYFISFTGQAAGLRSGNNEDNQWNLRWNGAQRLTTGRFRDPSAWYHVVLSQDATTARVFVNNSEQVNTNDDPLPNTRIRFGCDYTKANFLSGYLADVRFLDGLALEPNCFGRENAQGIWVPTAGSREDLAQPRPFNSEDYGANGFHLDFHDSANIGEDVAPTGNGHANANNFTADGFELTTATDPDFDQMTDSPTQNFATFNRLYPNKDAGFAESANLSCKQQGFTENSTIVFNTSTSGNWIAEFQRTTVGNNSAFGVAQTSIGYKDEWTDVYTGMRSSGKVKLGGVDQGETGVNWGTLGDVVDCRFTAADRSLRFRVNGNEVGAPLPITLPADTDFFVTGGITTDRPSGTVGAFNYGQQDFSHAPPAGFNALQTQTMPTPTILDGRDHFRAITTAAGTDPLPQAEAIFATGLYWIKDRVNDSQHDIVDSVRGTNLRFTCPTTGGDVAYSAPTGDSVTWCWNGGGAAVANTTGSIATQVSANNDGGFSIITYTGNGTAGATIGHGLTQHTQGPGFVICKSRETGQNFCVGSAAIDNWGTALYLNNNQAQEPTNGNGFWNSTAPSNTVITLGDHAAINTSGRDYVCYAWTAIPGYSAFGSYTGNGSADGAFVYLGFRPAFVLVKANAATNWYIMNSTTATVNPVDNWLVPNSINPDGTTPNMDLLANGFKVRSSSTKWNGNNTAYVYAAFAENPFGGEGTAPANAR